MAVEYVVNVDLAKITYSFPGNTKKYFRLLGWGDVIKIKDPAADISKAEIRIEMDIFENKSDNSVQPMPIVGTIKVPKSMSPDDVILKKSSSKILKIDFVDVQQGDGAVIETPDGKIILIDGGDNQLFARYLANRFRNSTAAKPRFVDCILITHGDADHFLGLTKIAESETNTNKKKQLFLCPERIFHNGLVKRPGSLNGNKLKDTEMLGSTVEVTDPETGKKVLAITGLEENLLKVPSEQMNQPFKTWAEVLRNYDQRLSQLKSRNVEFKRLEAGTDDAFDFLDDSISVKVLGPLALKNAGKSALRFLRTPPSGPRTSKEFLSVDEEGYGSFSASHTINGQSIVFQLRYGGFTFLFSGDLNDEAERILTREHNANRINLQSDVLKVPHHGSHDFSGAFLQAVAPVISVISSGDESSRKEYIHPRATLLGALGRYSRVDEPLIFITELVAFFQTEGWIRKDFHQLTAKGTAAAKKGGVVDPAEKDFFAFSRAAFGIVMVRTDGRRVLVYTNSALSDMKEAYAFEFDDHGKPMFVPIKKI